jgi:N-acetylmuramoyl-L-alanine amidase
MKRYFICLLCIISILLSGGWTPTLADAAISSVKTKTQSKEDNSKFTIVIDAGHQKHQNSDKEPIGPGAKTKKAKVSSGTQGKYTGVPEYKVNLSVAVKLRDILEEQGFKVIMIREKNDVDISNAERAGIANDKKADVFIRLHCNGSTNSSIHGILTICPTKKNPYCSDIYKESRKLSDAVLSSVCEATGAKNNKIMETDTMSGINWSKVPVTIVEMGYMTNKKEDYKLTDSKYQDKLAKGLAQGIEDYLK